MLIKYNKINIFKGYMIRQRYYSCQSSAVVLISEGDNLIDDVYITFAQQVYQTIVATGKYDKIFFNAQHNNCDVTKKLKIFKESIENCQLAVVVATPYGKKCYEKLLASGDFSKFRGDFFSLGCYALLHTRMLSVSREAKIFVAFKKSFHGNVVDFHVHKDLKRKAEKLFDVSNDKSLILDAIKKL